MRLLSPSVGVFTQRLLFVRSPLSSGNPSSLFCFLWLPHLCLLSFSPFLVSFPFPWPPFLPVCTFFGAFFIFEPHSHLCVICYFAPAPISLLCTFLPFRFSLLFISFYVTFASLYFPFPLYHPFHSSFSPQSSCQWWLVGLGVIQKFTKTIPGESGWMHCTMDK